MRISLCRAGHTCLSPISHQLTWTQPATPASPQADLDSSCVLSRSAPVGAEETVARVRQAPWESGLKSEDTSEKAAEVHPKAHRFPRSKKDPLFLGKGSDLELLGKPANTGPVSVLSVTPTARKGHQGCAGCSPGPSLAGLTARDLDGG